MKTKYYFFKPKKNLFTDIVKEGVEILTNILSKFNKNDLEAYASQTHKNNTNVTSYVKKFDFITKTLMDEMKKNPSKIKDIIKMAQKFHKEGNFHGTTVLITALSGAIHLSDKQNNKAYDKLFELYFSAGHIGLITEVKTFKVEGKNVLPSLMLLGHQYVITTEKFNSNQDQINSLIEKGEPNSQELLKEGEENKEIYENFTKNLFETYLSDVNTYLNEGQAHENALMA